MIDFETNERLKENVEQYEIYLERSQEQVANLISTIIHIRAGLRFKDERGYTYAMDICNQVLGRDIEDAEMFGEA